VKLIPDSFDRSFDNGPRLSLGCMAMIIGILIRYAFAHGNAWHFAVGFLNGLGVVLIIADFYGRWKTRAQKK
jgi:hypothetical protein